MSQICPKCKFPSLQLNRSMNMVCVQPKCDYMEFGQVTYENDVRNFDGEKAVENRFAGSYNA